MKIELTLAMIFILLASSAFAAGSGGSVVIDIVGSNADNVKVESGSEPVDLEIVGSKASNIKIAPPQVNILDCSCGYCCYPNERCNNSRPSYPWDSMHLGVDAWYGTFWYTDINMPKWPQL
jgi:hypothetical protein